MDEVNKPKIEVAQKNMPYMGSTKDWQPGTTTITGQYPNRKQRRAAAKNKKK